LRASDNSRRQKIHIGCGLVIQPQNNRNNKSTDVYYQMSVAR